MAFENVLGQPTAVETLRRAIATGRVHHAYRFEGPDGVGKDLTAFALAAELVAGPAGESATVDDARARVLSLSSEDPKVPIHPDVVLVARGLYSKVLGSQEASGIGVEQIRRVVLSRTNYAPHEGRALVFIVRDADEISVQAANALLKTLEEPGPRTHFILITSRPKRMLDTIRSRTLPVRFGPLPDAALRAVLGDTPGVDEVIPLAQGSASLAHALADAESVAERDAFVAAVRRAVMAPDATGAIALAEEFAGDRRSLGVPLAHLAFVIAKEARTSVKTDPRRAERAARRHAVVLNALSAIERNAGPAFVLEGLVMGLRSV
jgi:DNA polymerase-3 subunit delta'